MHCSKICKMHVGEHVHFSKICMHTLSCAWPMRCCCCRAMGGTVDFKSALKARLDVMNVSRQNIEQFLVEHPHKITKGGHIGCALTCLGRGWQEEGDDWRTFFNTVLDINYGEIMRAKQNVKADVGRGKGLCGRKSSELP